jgi:uncharacterized phage-like protein YoqJ
MILCATGHRPPKIFPYKIPNPKYNWVYEKIKEAILELKPKQAISGMALGFDQLFADVCIELHIPFIAAIPFIGQEKIWPQHEKDKYHALLKQAADQHIVCEGGYSPDKMQVRNCFMVDNSDVVLACFDGSKGGTGNCVDYAKSKNKRIVVIDPREFPNNSAL